MYLGLQGILSSVFWIMFPWFPLQFEVTGIWYFWICVQWGILTGGRGAFYVVLKYFLHVSARVSKFPTGTTYIYTYIYIYVYINDMYVYILYSTYILIYCWYIMTHNDTEWRYIYVICMHGRWNEIIYVFMFIACANKDPPLSVVKISAITDFEATHAKQGYRYRVIPYHSYIYILYIYIYTVYI